MVQLKKKVTIKTKTAQEETPVAVTEPVVTTPDPAPNPSPEPSNWLVNKVLGMTPKLLKIPIHKDKGMRMLRTTVMILSMQTVQILLLVLQKQENLLMVQMRIHLQTVALRTLVVRQQQRMRNRM